MSEDAQFDEFLQELNTLSITQVISIERWKPGTGESVLVGRGSYSADTSARSSVLALNNKATEARFGSTYTSLARLMVAPPAAFFDGWTLWAERPLAVAAALARITLVVEDASPDSVIGILLLLMHLQGLKPERVPADWIDAIDQWEREGTVETPGTAWTALASALAHRHYSVGKTPTDQENGIAWTETLRFAAQCLQRGAHPFAIPEMPELALWRSAQVALRQEEQTYLGWLPHADQVQLSLPANGSNDRRLVVDGLLFAEDQATGAAKVFYRNDRDHSPLGRGFTFAAHHRPSEKRTGNDFTIAVDPREGVNIKELWHELERREVEAWAGPGLVRPSDNPRKLDGVQNKWNEPWYLKEGDDLIGAPREVDVVGPDGKVERKPGTLLGWPDIREAIWTVFNPLKGVIVHPMHEDGHHDDNNLAALLNLAPVSAAPHARPHWKHLLLAKWPSFDKGGWAGMPPRALNDSPTVDRVIAALISQHGRGTIGLNHLPPVGGWEKLTLSGGFAILTHDGLFVLDDWRDWKLKAAEEICETFHLAARLDQDLRDLEKDKIEPLKKAMKQAVTAKNAGRSHGEIMLLLLAADVGVRLAVLRSYEARIPDSPDARSVRTALDRQWGLDRRLTGLEQQVKSFSEALGTLGEARLLGITRFIGTYAFGPYIAANLAGPLAKLTIQLVQNAGPEKEAPAWLWWVCFGVISVAIAGGLRLWFTGVASKAERT
jgi:hypothetical protein